MKIIAGALIKVIVAIDDSHTPARAGLYALIDGLKTPMAYIAPANNMSTQDALTLRVVADRQCTLVVDDMALVDFLSEESGASCDLDIERRTLSGFI